MMIRNAYSVQKRKTMRVRREEREGSRKERKEQGKIKDEPFSLIRRIYQLPRRKGNRRKTKLKKKNENEKEGGKKGFDRSLK